MSKNLSKRAMLAQLSLSVWTGRKRDAQVSTEVAANKGAENDSGAWWTYLVPRKALSKVYSAYGKVRAVHNQFTLPWNDSGCRILPSKLFLEYAKAMRDAEDGFDVAVKDFLKDYPNILANAKKRLGHLLDNETLPTVQEIKSKFGVNREIYPLPDVTDFRVDISEKDAKQIRAQMSENIDATIGKAMSNIWEQLNTLVSKIESTLSEPDKIFRDTLLTNLGDFCKLIPKLNLTENKDLETMRVDIVKKLTSLRPDTLRDEKPKRKQVAKAAKEVLRTMKKHMSK